MTQKSAGLTYFAAEVWDQKKRQVRTDSKGLATLPSCHRIKCPCNRLSLILWTLRAMQKKTIKLKQSLNRSGQTLRDPGSWSSQISWQLTHGGGKVVSPTHRSPLLPRKYCWFSFLLEAEWTQGSLCGRKNHVNKNIIMRPPAIKHTTFRLAAPLCTFTHTYLFALWSRVLLEKLTGFQIIKNFPAFYGTRKFITALTSARRLSLSKYRSRSEAYFMNVQRG